MNLSKEQIANHLQQVLIDLFELEASAIHKDANLYEDLDIDSIDTIDLLIELKKVLKQDIDPQKFKSVSTFQDVVDVIADL